MAKLKWLPLYDDDYSIDGRWVEVLGMTLEVDTDSDYYTGWCWRIRGLDDEIIEDGIADDQKDGQKRVLTKFQKLLKDTETQTMKLWPVNRIPSRRKK